LIAVLWGLEGSLLQAGTNDMEQFSLFAHNFTQHTQLDSTHKHFRWMRPIRNFAPCEHFPLYGVCRELEVIISAFLAVLGMPLEIYGEC
jgi:hypothetical protein